MSHILLKVLFFSFFFFTPKPKSKSALRLLREIQMKYFITSYLCFIAQLRALQTLTSSVSCIFKSCKLFGANLRSMCEKINVSKTVFVLSNAAPETSQDH